MAVPAVSVTCRKAAVFSDIHSNYYAFKACYEDALLHGADCFLFLGDYISDLADPVKTLELVYEIRARYPTVCLRGNRESYMLDCAEGRSTFSRGSKSGSLLYTFDRLRRQDLAFIQSLPSYGTVEINGLPFALAHATKDNDRFYFEKADNRIRRVFTQMDRPYLLTGHSHKQYVQTFRGKTILNPGSVGISQGGARWPQYALLDVSDHTVSYSFQQVPYDLAETIHAQFESGLVEYANCWAISILYDVITGREYTLQLLERMAQHAVSVPSAFLDETLWRKTAIDMGMRLTEAEILAFWDAYRQR